MNDDPKSGSGFYSFFTVIGILVTLLFGVAILIDFVVPRAVIPAKKLAAVKSAEPAGQSSSYAYSFGGSSQLGSNTVLRLNAINSPRTVAFSSGSYFNWGRTVNYLVVDPDNGESHWLWKAPLPRVFAEYPLNRSGEKDKGDRGILVALIEKDTNGDNQLDEKDAQSIAVIKPDGKTVVTLVKGLSQVSGVVMIDAKRMLFLYEKNGQSYSAIYFPDSYSLTLEKQLPAIVLP